LLAAALRCQLNGLLGSRGGLRGAGRGLAGLPVSDHGVEPPGDFLQLADGRAASPGEHGVLAGVFGEGGDQEFDDCRERLAQWGSRDVLHS
jgi:hypothetical protein